MNRQYFLDLAARGARLPIGADLILHEYADPTAILENGERLGRVLEETARRFDTPLALPHMDLELEKAMLMGMLGVAEGEVAKFHFQEAPGAEAFAAFHEHLSDPLPARSQAHVDSIAYIANHTDLVPVGMAIGPFSLMTKLVADPITPIALYGNGLTAEDDEEIQMVSSVMELAIKTILRSLAAQVKAGAKVVFIAEPAANKVYLSPNQIEAGSDIFEHFVMSYNRQIAAFLEEHGVQLIFHCCGELTEYMVKKFCELHPVMLSLGSSRKLWEDAAIVPADIILFGNLPSKRFYSDALITVEQVKQTGDELIEKMREVNHPFILGTECDVLSVPGCEATIYAKVRAIMRRGCGCLGKS